jgi:peptide/nickel transport system substrate-binding protein
MLKRLLACAVFLAGLLPSASAAGPSVAETVLRICDDVKDPSSLDPYQVFTEKEHTILQQILEGLVRFDPDGKLEPCLAESWERVDPLRMRFHLRRGVKFHNGEVLDSRAVKFSLEKYINPQTKYPGFGFISTISGVEVVDDHTVDVMTAIPDGLLLNRLAAWIHIVPPDTFLRVGDDGFAQHPVGTGPFKFEEWKKGDRIILSANKEYWMPGFPKVDKLVFLFREFDTQFEMLKAGKIDLMTECPGTRTIWVMDNPGTSIIKRNTFWTVGAMMNINKPPLSDVRVRKAMNMALNKSEMLQYEALNNGTSLATFTMKGEEGHNSALVPYEFNLEKARRLLEEAGVKTPLVLKTSVREQGVRVAGAIRAQLKDIGIELDLHVFSDAEMIQKLQSESWDLGIAGLPDPMCSSFFISSILLYSKSPFSITRSPEFDHKLEAMMTVLDDKERARLGRELDAYVYNEVLGLFTVQKVKTYGVNERLRFIPSVTGMSHFYKAYFLKKPIRPKKAVELD